MKRMAFFTMSLMVMVTVARSAWADGSAGAQQGSLLVLLFLGVCALVVVAQMVPALILMMGTVSGFAKRIAARKRVAMAEANHEKSL